MKTFRIDISLLESLIWVVISLMVCCIDAGASPLIRLERIDLHKTPCRIEIKLSKNPSSKIVPIGEKELLIALKHVRGGEKVKIGGSAEPLIRKISIDTPSNDVVTVLVNTRGKIQSVSQAWDRARKILAITFSETKSSSTGANRPKRSGSLPAASKMAGKESRKQEKNNNSTDVAAKKNKAVKPAVKTEKSIYSGTIDDFFIELKDDACLKDKGLFAALKFYQTQMWRSAFDAASDYIRQQPNSSCLEKAYLIKAYSFYKNMIECNGKQLESIDFFQEVIDRFPKSSYIPYVYTALGKIHMYFKNSFQAEGYFNLVLDQYRNYNGTPEALFELGRIYYQKDKAKKAISFFKLIISEYSWSDLVSAAKRELGKSMLEVNDYAEALKILVPLSESDPRVLYESPDLLLDIGNAYYCTGDSEKARLMLSKAYNFFPKIVSGDEVLSRIADSFIEQKQPEKAVKIYEYIVAKFPETEGCYTALMRLAHFVEGREEKERLYRKVVRNSQSDSQVRLAMMRLAGLYNESGKYEKSIEMMNALLKDSPRSFRNEALYLMQEAYARLFEELSQQENYPSILARYEKNKALLNKIKSPEIFRRVGQAYVDGHLYAPALNVLMKSYQSLAEGKRPADLMYNLGVAMQESQRRDEALNILNAFIREFPESSDAKDACKRRASILLAKHDFKGAIKDFKKAYASSTEVEEKAKLLTDEAGAHQAMGNHQVAADLLIKAINQLASAPADHFNLIAETYRRLGEIYLVLGACRQAADAFSMSAKFSGKEDNLSEIQFAIGQAYQKANITDKALQIYGKVIENQDPLWAKLARENTKVIELQSQLGEQTNAPAP